MKCVVAVVGTPAFDLLTFSIIFHHEMMLFFLLKKEITHIPCNYIKTNTLKMSNLFLFVVTVELVGPCGWDSQKSGEKIDTRTTLLGKEEPFNWRPWGACWGGRETRCEAKKTLVVVVIRIA